MTPEAQKALVESIVKWEKNTKVQELGEISIGTKSCPLCVLYWRKGCEGCPIAKATGTHSCIGTPYDLVVKWIDRKNVWKIYNADDFAEENVLLEQFRAIAEEEVKFLQSLLNGAEK